MPTRYLVPVLTVALCWSLTACKTDRTSGSAKRPALKAAQDANPGPIDMRKELMRRALEGLNFESGLVEIDRSAAEQRPGFGDRDLALERCAQAREHLDQNLREDAIQSYKEAIYTDPGLAEAYVGLGLALTTKGETDYAIAAYRTALTIEPENVEAHFRLGMSHHMKGEWSEAIEQFRLVIELDPAYPKAHVRLAIALYYAGDVEGAREAADMAETAGQRVPPQFASLLDGNIPTAGAAERGVGPEIGPQVRIDPAGTTYAANETTIAASEVNPMVLVGSWNDWRQSPPGDELINTGASLSFDGGDSWSDFLIRPPVAYQTSVEGDPMTAFDNRTGDLWVGGITFGSPYGVYIARLRPGQLNFDPSVMAYVGYSDKGWIAAGENPGTPGADTIVYITFSAGCVRSTNMGANWSAPVGLGSGIGFLPRVGPQGQLYVAYWDFGDGVMLKRSLNGGQSFEAAIEIASRMDVWGTQDGSRFPGWFRVPSINYLAVDPNNGTLYCVYMDTTNMVGGNYNVDLYFSKSTDEGQTWTPPTIVPHADFFYQVDQWFPWIEVDRDGRIHLVYYDGRGNPSQNDNTEHGMFYTYYAYSEDGGNTWHEYRLALEAWDSANDGLNRSNQFVGDYSGMTVSGKRVYPCYMSSQNGDPDTFVHVIRFVGDGDTDNDNDVDLRDALGLQGCFGQAGAPLPAGCDDLDMDASDAIDLDDHSAWMIRLTGPS